MRAIVVSEPGGPEMLQAMALPPTMDMLTAGGLAEVFVTAHDALVTQGRLTADQSVLIVGGAGGVGTAAIQVARRIGARVLVTAGTEKRREACRTLGADVTLDRHDPDLAAAVLEATSGRGVDVIVDVMGAALLARNLDVIAPDGRVVVIGLQGGTRAEIDLSRLLQRRASLIGTTLRGRPTEMKCAVVRRFAEDALSAVANGDLGVVVDSVNDLAEAGNAHKRMEAGEPIGKILLEVARFSA